MFATLNSAYLWQANLDRSDFLGADLNMACLEEANLEAAKFLTFEQLISSSSLYKCQLPKGINAVELAKMRPELFEKSIYLK